MSKKICKIIYLLLGTIFPVLVGLAHTWAHFQDLTTAAIQDQLAAPIEIMGAEQNLWNTWGLMSFMMGISFVIIGLLHLLLMQKQSRQDYPSIPGWCVIILYLISVIYAASTFSATPQYYGGIFSLGLAILSLALTLKERRASRVEPT